MHAHLYINGASVMMSDFYPEQGHPPLALRGSASCSKSMTPTPGMIVLSTPAAPHNAGR